MEESGKRCQEKGRGRFTPEGANSGTNGSSMRAASEAFGTNDRHRGQSRLTE